MKKLLLILGLVICAASAQAVNFPYDLKYNGRAIDPDCITGSDPGVTVKIPAVVDLKKCTGTDGKTLKALSLKNKEITVSTGERNDESYSYLGQAHGGSAVLVENRGGCCAGGSIYIVKKDGNSLHVLEEISPDYNMSIFKIGCNLDPNATIKDGNISYSTNIEPRKFLKLAANDPNGITAKDDDAHVNVKKADYLLSDNCLGQANFAEGKLISVTIGNIADPDVELDALENSEDGGKYQVCFNGIYNSYLKADAETTEITVPQLKDLTDKFNKQCVAKTTPK